MQGRLTAEITEIKSNLSVYKEKLESKERVEVKARSDLQQASKLNEEVSELFLFRLSVFFL